MSQALPNNPTQQVIERVLARPVAEPDPQHGRLVHIMWTAPLQGERVVQFYVDGELAGYSHSPLDRAYWLVCDARVHHQIELLAITPGNAATPSSNWLAGIDPGTNPNASIKLLRDMSLPVDSILSVQVDDGEPVATPLFAADTPRGGFGAVFGQGGFGYDASTGPGLGFGQLGYGPLGIDGDSLDWTNAMLTDGPHDVQFNLEESGGNQVATTLDLQRTVSRLPDPPTHVALSTDLKLTWI